MIDEKEEAEEERIYPPIWAHPMMSWVWGLGIGIGGVCLLIAIISPSIGSPNALIVMVVSLLLVLVSIIGLMLYDRECKRWPQRNVDPGQLALLFIGIGMIVGIIFLMVTATPRPTGLPDRATAPTSTARLPSATIFPTTEYTMDHTTETTPPATTTSKVTTTTTPKPTTSTTTTSKTTSKTTTVTVTPQAPQPPFPVPPPPPPPQPGPEPPFPVNTGRVPFPY